MSWRTRRLALAPAALLLPPVRRPTTTWRRCCFARRATLWADRSRAVASVSKRQQRGQRKLLPLLVEQPVTGVPRRGCVRTPGSAQSRDQALASTSLRERQCLELLPIGSAHASTSCLCTGRDGSGQVAIPVVVPSGRAPTGARALALVRERAPCARFPRFAELLSGAVPGGALRAEPDRWLACS
jgi:hypothetical protein